MNAEERQLFIDLKDQVDAFRAEAKEARERVDQLTGYLRQLMGEVDPATKASFEIVAAAVTEARTEVAGITEAINAALPK